MAEAAQSQFPPGMEYLAADPQATVYLDLAQQLRVVNDQAGMESEAYRAGVAEVAAKAREAGIPEGYLSRISVLALSMQPTEGKD